MQFLCSRKLLFAGLLLHCFLITSMEQPPKPTSWAQVTLEMIKQLNYEALSPEDKINYRLRFAQLIENSKLGYDALVNSRLRLAELNAGSVVQQPGVFVQPNPPSPVSSSSSDSSTSPSPTEPMLPESSQPTFNFQDADLDLAGLAQISIEKLSPRSLASYNSRIDELKSPNGASPAQESAIFPDIPSPRAQMQETPPAPSPIPLLAENPIFTSEDVESRSPDSSLLAKESIPLRSTIHLPEPILAHRPHSAPPVLQPVTSTQTSSPLLRPTSPTLSHSSSESSSASREILMPSVGAHHENGVFATDIQSTASFRAESPFSDLLSPATESPRDISSASESSSASDVSDIEPLALTNDFSTATQDQIDVQRAMGIGVLTPRSRISLESRAQRLSEQVNKPSIFPEPVKPVGPIANPQIPSINLSQMNLKQLKEIDSEHFTPRTKDFYDSRLRQLLQEAKAQQEPNSNTTQAPASQPGAPNVPENTEPALAPSNKLIKTLEVAGIALAVWTTAEAIGAYKNISKQEWQSATKWHNKFALIARKTGGAMASRPGQIQDLITKTFGNT